MKSIITSVSPYLCGKIASGDCRMLVKKFALKEVPFKAYIYCTKAKSQWRYSDYEGAYENSEGEIVYAQQHIIGEFICDKVDRYPYDCCDGIDIDVDTILDTAIDREDINIYAKDKTLYGLHISDLKIYDKPKELSEFKTGCKGCKEGDIYHCKFYCYGERPLSRPPSSWQYVEELRNE